MLANLRHVRHEQSFHASPDPQSACSEGPGLCIQQPQHSRFKLDILGFRSASKGRLDFLSELLQRTVILCPELLRRVSTGLNTVFSYAATL